MTRVFTLSVLVLALLASAAQAQARAERDLTLPLTAATQAALTPADVVQLLKDGNTRFLAGQSVERNFLEQIRLTAGGQFPMAAILGCIDSRVPHGHKRLLTRRDRITLGLRHGEIEWKHRLNDFLDARRAEIQSILLQYGVPLLDEQDKPVIGP